MMRVIIVVLVFIGAVLAVHPILTNQLIKQQSGNDVQKAVAVLTGDAKASSESEVPVTESDLHKLRLEFIKAQILKKLQLNEVPDVAKTTNKLPVPMIVTATTPVPLIQQETSEEEAFYAKTNQVMLISHNVTGESCEYDPKPSVCFGFDLPEDLAEEEISSAELWIHKLRDFFDKDPHVNQTLVYYDVNGDEESEILRQSTIVEDGWIKLTLTRRVKIWLANNHLSPQLKVSCTSCGYSMPWIPFSMGTTAQPLLVINVENNMQKKRPRRNINCHAEIIECCREKLYVNFKDVGWDNWILQPEGYHAYFCTGSCNGATATSLSNSVYTSILRKLFVNTKRVELIPCCAATEHSSISLIYRTDNSTVAKKTLPNMIVDSCGCM